MNSKISIYSLMKIINIVFLVVLQNFVLDCGMGIFGVALLLYYVLYTVFFGSLQTGIAKMVNIRNAKGMNGNSQRIVKPALLYVAIVGIIHILVSFIVPEGISVKLLGITYPIPVIQILSIVFLLAGITDVLCGYHTGNGDAYVTNIANLLKCILPIIFSFFILRSLSGYGSKVASLVKNSIAKDAYAAMGIATVYLTSTFVVFLVVVFFTIKNKLRSGGVKSVRGIDSRRSVAGGFVSVNAKLMLNNVFPVVSVLIPILFYINNAQKAGIAMADAYTNLGIVFTKILLPFMFVLLIFVEYIGKERHRVHIDYRKDEVKVMTMRSQYMIKNSFFMLIPPTMFFIFLSAPIANVLFAGQTTLSAKYLQTGGAILILAGLAIALNAILRAFDRTVISWGIQGISLFVQLLFLLVSYSKASGNSMMILYSGYIYYGIQVVVCLVLLLKVIRLDFLDILMKLGKYGVAGIIMMILFMILDKFITMNIFLLLLSLFFGYLLYYLSLLALHGISKKDEAALKRTLNYYPVHFLRSRLRL